MAGANIKFEVDKESLDRLEALAARMEELTKRMEALAHPIYIATTPSVTEAEVGDGIVEVLRRGPRCGT